MKKYYYLFGNKIVKTTNEIIIFLSYGFEIIRYRLTGEDGNVFDCETVKVIYDDDSFVIYEK